MTDDRFQFSDEGRAELRAGLGDDADKTILWLEAGIDAHRPLREADDRERPKRIRATLGTMFELVTGLKAALRGAHGAGGVNVFGRSLRMSLVAADDETVRAILIGQCVVAMRSTPGFDKLSEARQEAALFQLLAKQIAAQPELGEISRTAFEAGVLAVEEGARGPEIVEVLEALRRALGAAHQRYETPRHRQRDDARYSLLATVAAIVEAHGFDLTQTANGPLWLACSVALRETGDPVADESLRKTVKAAIAELEGMHKLD